MPINPFEVASKYGYNADTFAGDQNFNSYWSNKTEGELVQGLQARADWSPSRMNVPDSNGNMDIANGADTTFSGGIDNSDAFNNTWSTINSGKRTAFEMKQQALADRDAENKTKLSQAESDVTKYQTGLEDKIGRDIYEELLAEQKNIGYDEKVKAADDVYSQILDLEEQYITDTHKAKRQTTFNSIIKGDLGNIKDNYIETGTMLNNRLALLDRNLDRMDKQLSRFYDVYSEQRRDEISNQESLLTMAKNNVISLTADQRNLIDKSIEMKQAQEDENNANAATKRQLFMEAAQNGIYYMDLDIKPSDTLDDIIAKLAPAMKAKYDQEQYNSNYNNNIVEDGLYPEGLSNTEKLAFDTAREIYKLEGEGFSKEDWERHVNDFISKSKGNYSFEEGSKLLSQGMYNFKNKNNITQLTTTQEKPKEKDNNEISVDLSSSTPQSYWWQNLGDKIKESTSSESFNKIKTDNIQKMENTINNLNNDIAKLSSITNPSAAEKRALKNAKSKLAREQRILSDYKRGGTK